MGVLLLPSDAASSIARGSLVQMAASLGSPRLHSGNLPSSRLLRSVTDPTRSPMLACSLISSTSPAAAALQRLIIAAAVGWGMMTDGHQSAAMLRRSTAMRWPSVQT